MGCDIHMHLQVKHKDDTGWAYVPCPMEGSFEWRINRWYGDFGALAAVRNDPKPGTIMPRGLPEDFSRYELSEDDHTPSWMTFDEIMAIRHEWGCGMSRLIAVMRMYDEKLDTRIVFWFDN